MASPQASAQPEQHSVLNSNFPVLLPADEALFLSEAQFQALIREIVVTPDHTTQLDSKISPSDKDIASTQKAPFVQGLEKHAANHRTPQDLAADNKVLTENGDVTNISAKNPLVDLFYDLGESTKGSSITTLLEDAWLEDPVVTLRIIFNARSIHLGKSNRVAAYQAFGWLADNHPRTLLANLPFLVRPVIAKKTAIPKDDDSSKAPSHITEKMDVVTLGDELVSNASDDDFDMVDVEDAGPTRSHDVPRGLSHGYWKDLLNLVVLASNDQLKVDGNPSSVLNNTPDKSVEGKRKRDWDQDSAKEARWRKRSEQHERVQKKLQTDPFYRALHISIARLFAEQLKKDKTLLATGKASNLKKLSLAAKWAPSHGESVDKHTFILSTLSEILFPQSEYFTGITGRETYLRQARELYRKQYGSPLRKALKIVERDIAANNFGAIQYEQVPSLAMGRYTRLFLSKDTERFTAYVHDVASGNAKISGATLLPSTLVAKVREAALRVGGRNIKELKAAAEAKVMHGVLDGQWKTLVKRVRDAGTLKSSIAVCDVSGSMSWPQFKDGSTPMDGAIGLSLLVAELTEQPFGGGFISFHESPSYISLKGRNGLKEQVQFALGSPWGGSTNLVAVFEEVILPMAIANKLTQDDMVKQVFVFSDMQFDQASGYGRSDRWTSSYERIKQKYADAGYQMPSLIFWNLAANSTSKPVTMDNMDIALVSGYSQGMLRALLEGGTFDEEDEVEEKDASDDDDATVVTKQKKKIDPLTVVQKATSNQAYKMLQLVD